MKTLLFRTTKYAPRVDQLWMIVFFTGILFVTSLVPLLPHDFWWHLKVGEIIVETRTIPTTNMFGWTLDAAHPYAYGSWLGEVIFYLLYQLGRMKLIIFIRNFLFGISFFLVAWEAKRRSHSWRVTAIVLLLSFAMASDNLQIRPQMFSVLPFVTFLILLNRYATNQLKATWLLVCPLMMLFWVNAHGAFILGFILLGIFAVGEVIQQISKQTDPRTWRKTVWLLVVTVLTLIALLGNPDGFGIFSTVLDLITDKPVQSLAAEWQSPTPHGLANVAFFLSILGFTLCVWYGQAQPRIVDVIQFTCFLCLALSAKRHVIWYSLMVMPILAENISGILDNKQWHIFKENHRNILNIIIATLVLIPVVLVQPWFIERDIIPLPSAYQEKVLERNDVGPLIGVETPIGAVEYLESHPGRRFFNESAYGSYFIWAMQNPSVFIDPRIDLYPYELWHDYINISNGIRYNRVLDKYHVDRLVIDIQHQANLIQSLQGDPLWELVYEDNRTQIWDKRFAGE